MAAVRKEGRFKHNWCFSVFHPFAANGAIQNRRKRNKDESVLKRGLGSGSEGGPRPEGEGGGGHVADGEFGLGWGASASTSRLIWKTDSAAGSSLEEKRACFPHTVITHNQTWLHRQCTNLHSGLFLINFSAKMRI